MAWVYSFTGGTDGANPIAGLSLNGSTLYGAAFFGGANGQGTLFSIPTTGGTPTVLHAFDSKAGEGAGPGGTPVFDANGTTMLGTTTFDSINSSNVGAGNGTVYSYALSGAYSVVHTFAGSADGANSYSSLLYSRCSNVSSPQPPLVFYGTTTAGGSGRGTVFSVASSVGGYQYNQISMLSGASGTNIYAPVACDNFSTLYGTTVLGGAANRGSSFQMKTSGSSAATTNSFNVSNAAGQPRGGLYVVDGSHLVGTGTVSGASGRGAIFMLTYISGMTYGYTSIYDFVNGTDGSGPWATLISDDNGNLYGTTVAGGASGNGTIYKLTKRTNGYAYSQLYSFAGASDGSNPLAALVWERSTGRLYGTTKAGGSNGKGTVFALTP